MLNNQELPRDRVHRTSFSFSLSLLFPGNQRASAPTGLAGSILTAHIKDVEKELAASVPSATTTRLVITSAWESEAFNSNASKTRGWPRRRWWRRRRRQLYSSGGEKKSGACARVEEIRARQQRAGESLGELTRRDVSGHRARCFYRRENSTASAHLHSTLCLALPPSFVPLYLAQSKRDTDYARTSPFALTRLSLCCDRRL